MTRHLEVVKKSYSVLSDPVKRGLYDQLISESNRDDFPDQTQTLQAEPSNGGEAQPSDAPAQYPTDNLPPSQSTRAGLRISTVFYLIAGLTLVVGTYFFWIHIGQDKLSEVTDLTYIDEPEQGYQFSVENRCQHPITLAIRYWGLDEIWHTNGWWDLDPGVAAYLEDEDGNRLISNNAVWYYYAKTTGGVDLEWSGRYRFVVDGEVLRMIELKDTAGDSELSLSCDEPDFSLVEGES